MSPADSASTTVSVLTDAETSAANERPTQPQAVRLVPEPTGKAQNGWLSTTKDVVGIIQNLFAIGAIVCAGFWFYLQRPFSPTLRATTSTTVTKGNGYFLISVTAIFQNVGRVPYHYTCWGGGVFSDSTPLPKATCGSAITLNPGEQRVVGDVIMVPDDQRQVAQFFRAELGNVRSGGWDPSSQSAIQALLIDDREVATSTPTTPKEPLPKRAPNSHPTSSQLWIKQGIYTAERQKTPKEIEEEEEYIRTHPTA